MSSGETMTDHTEGRREPSAPSRGSAADKPLAWSVMIEGTTVFSVWLDEEEATRERRRLKKLYEGTRHGRIVVVPLYDRHPKKRKK